jgi:hypothetical protein
MVEMTAKKEIFYVRKRPAKYPLTQHQQDLIQASIECGIAKGITRSELVDKMVHCVPDKYKEVKERRENGEKSD